MARRGKLLNAKGVIDLSGDVAADVARPRRNTQPFATNELGDDGWQVARVRRSTVPPVAMSEGKDESRTTQMPPAIYEPKAHSTAPPPEWFDSAQASEEVFWIRDMKERYELGDFNGALGLAELVLGRQSKNPEALAYRTSAKNALSTIYSSKLGNIDRVFVLAVPRNELHWRGNDRQADSLIAQLDGERTLREVIDASGLEFLIALRLLVELFQSGVIATR
jgi:hypothetical protein